MACNNLDVTSKVSLVQLAMGGLSQYVTEDQIEQVLSAQPIVTYAAAILVGSICAGWVCEVDFSSGDTSYKASQKLKACEALIARLRAVPGDFIGGDGSGTLSPTVFAGGESKSGMRALRKDKDLVQPSFTIGQFDDNGSGVSEDDSDGFV